MLDQACPQPQREARSAMIDIEICIDSVESAIAADRGGAQRVELCSALSQAGITPSSGLIHRVRQSIAIDLYVIIRPRGGHFVYTGHEFEVMGHDIRHAQSLGANGVVLGILTSDHRVDTVRTRQLVEMALPLSVTFHRAFDLCTDLDAALEDVISCGADRILTSGGSQTALEGVDRIAHLQRSAAGRIRIMPGSGVRASNVAHLIKSTAVTDVHTSLKSNHALAASETGTASTSFLIDEAAPWVVREEDVRVFRQATEELG
jgi:copper homeostasis protein